MIIIFAFGLVIGKILGTNQYKDKLKKTHQMSDKHFQLYFLMNQWVRIKQDNYSIAQYLLSRNYRKIAIYGMNYVGETLARELKGTDIEVLYGIDQNALYMYSEIDLITPDKITRDMDVIIVTPITYYEEIKKGLSNQVECDILSIGNILEHIEKSDK